MVCECYTAYHWMPSALQALKTALPGVELAIALECTADPLAALRAGMGVGVLSEWVAEPHLRRGDVVARRLASGPIPRPWRLVWRNEVQDAALGLKRRAVDSSPIAVDSPKPPPHAGRRGIQLRHDHPTPRAMRPRSMRFDSPQRRARRALFGLSVVGIGALALLDNLHVFDTALLRTYWPLVLVVWGVGRLAWAHHASSRVFGVVLVAVGALMTAHNLGHVNVELRQWWPVFVILGGVAIALRGMFPRACGGRRWQFESSTIEHAEQVDVDARFSGVKLQNDSPAFKGGRISAAFGGVELDLRQAVMAGPEAALTIDAKFSGIELRVPREWQVLVQMSSTLGGVDDKTAPLPSAQHRLVLRGETVFGGVNIKN